MLRYIHKLLLAHIILSQVTYSVNADGGYVAEVSYEGTAVFPEVTYSFAFCPKRTI